ncbi:MAG TPA: nuclear transport factor 2 family protein [Acidimicrobiales bacterium]
MADVPPHEAIRNLLGRYCELIDAGDLDGLGEMFARAVIRNEGGEELGRGPAAAARVYAGVKLYPDGTPRTRHLTTNSVIEVNEAAGTATARSAYVVFQATDALALQPIIAGSYRDRFARDEDGGWYFTERTFGVSLVGKLGEHLAFPVTPAD